MWFIKKSKFINTITKRTKMGKTIFLLCLCILVGFGIANSHDHKRKEKFGFYELRRGNISVKLTNWGATVVSFVIPDKRGKPIDIVLGYDTIKQYENDTTYFGAVVGRVANRIGGAKFKLNGKGYKLVPNEGKNMLHGGPKGFADVIWNVAKYSKTHIRFTYNSFDGEEGFPGNLQVTATYSLLEDNQLSVITKARALNKETPVSLAQHTYWNLGGQNNGNILSEKIQIFASKYTPVDSELIPTGKIVPVKGTPYDFLKPETIGSRIKKLPKGYDINYALDGGEIGSKLRKAAILYDSKSGLKMELSTNAPGLQFYTGNMIKDVKGKNGYMYKAHAGLCLETQWFPDFVNRPNFSQSIVQPGKTYKHHMFFKFSYQK